MKQIWTIRKDSYDPMFPFALYCQDEGEKTPERLQTNRSVKAAMAVDSRLPWEAVEDGSDVVARAVVTR